MTETQTPNLPNPSLDKLRTGFEASLGKKEED